ncbi:hypothetical protein K8O68_18915 [Salipaludibacillus sp. CUR1]|uniref:hypothetical protein n=1 Tax=Salipaludibacillus sp. CUR1 TaxID=2820003 RepID=UPI001E5F4E5D|nr:hypothetical protein [Salipaludibacillus sp. CUR1]MCE7794457.1 hypothetical protein [Salipaludibacillus sp. CUR1]
MKKIVSGLIVVGLLSVAGGVNAHEHYIETPNGKHIIISEEPEHVHEDHHPIHYKLHIGPSSENRAIKVAAAFLNEDGQYVDADGNLLNVVNR